jgi:hypothetical protein
MLIQMLIHQSQVLGTVVKSTPLWVYLPQTGRRRQSSLHRLTNAERRNS